MFVSICLSLSVCVLSVSDSIFGSEYERILFRITSSVLFINIVFPNVFFIKIFGKKILKTSGDLGGNIDSPDNSVFVQDTLENFHDTLDEPVSTTIVSGTRENR